MQTVKTITIYIWRNVLKFSFSVRWTCWAQMFFTLYISCIHFAIFQTPHAFTLLFVRNCKRVMHNFFLFMCSSKKYSYMYVPLRRNWSFLGGVGGSVRPKNLKTCMKLNWKFQSGGRVLGKIPSVREVWIFSRITQCVWLCKKLSLVVVVVAVNDWLGTTPII